MRTDVAILIVTYNSERHIEACLNSVFQQRGEIKQEVIVVDNASTDHTVELVQNNFPTVTLLVPGSNLGFAAGVNLGARRADADYFLLLNPDTIVLDHAIDVLVAFARANPNNGVYGGRTLKTDGSIEPSSCWGIPDLWSLAMFASGLSTIARRSRLFDPESLGKWPRDTIREVGVITGCLLLVACSVWEQLGGLDERYFMYGEDVDFSMRARVSGYHPIICPAARIIHEVGQSSATPTHKLLMLYQGKACFFRTHYSGSKLRLALFLLGFGVGLRATVSKLFSSFLRKKQSNDWSVVWRNRHLWLKGYVRRSGSARVD